MATALDNLLTATADICGGRLRIDGTRITVHRLATLYRQGLSAEQMTETYPHLSLSQVYTALAWYHANKDIIDAELNSVDQQYDTLAQQHDGKA